LAAIDVEEAFQEGFPLSILVELIENNVLLSRSDLMDSRGVRDSVGSSRERYPVGLAVPVKVMGGLCACE
jgi:hypothetical protein